MKTILNSGKALFSALVFLCITNKNLNAKGLPKDEDSSRVKKTSKGEVKNIKTEVFVLSTCQPGSMSMEKQYETEFTKKEQVNKLEVRSNKPSSLIITGINPLRYKYYINNKAVTQFMESSPLTFAINSFVNGDYLNDAPEIKVPEIFKVDSILSKARSKIYNFKNKNKLYEDSIDYFTNLIEGRFETLKDSVGNKYSKDKDTNRYKQVIKELNTGNIKDINYNKLWYLLYRQRKYHDDNLKEYQIYTGGLPINNTEFGIIDEYRKIDFTICQDSNIGYIKKIQRDFGNQYLEHNRNFKKIDSILFNLEKNYPDTSSFNLLITMLQLYHFNWSLSTESVGEYRNEKVNFLNNINDVKEQILNKRFQLYEEFVLNVATKIGVLVQNQFIEYSSFNNAILNYNYINDSALASIQHKKERLINTFEFIQKTNAELQIMVSYLDINTNLYESIARKINNNYVFLLSYLKNLDYVIKENTIQYTLPTHTNLKNIDLIRYEVKREDKITNSSQSYNYDFWVRGGLKIDFSIGFFGTRLTDNLYNKVLLDTVGGIDKIRITRQDDGRVNFAFGGMVNVTPRHGASWVNVGGSVGVAYSGNQKLQVLTGLSLHFGKTERLILHGGVGFGTIKYLDISANDFKFFDRDLKTVSRDKLNEIKERDRVYMLQSPDIKFSSYTIPLVDKFVIRPFIGISYNLSKKNALQAVSGAGVTAFGDNYKNGVSY